MGLDLGDKQRKKLTDLQKHLSKKFLDDFNFADELMQTESTALQFVSLCCTISITLDSATKAADGTYTVVLNVTGASKIAWYAQYYSTSVSYVTNLESYLINANPTAKLVDVVDGKATVTYKPGSNCLYAIGYNVGTDGKVVELSKTESAFKSKWTDLLTAN